MKLPDSEAFGLREYRSNLERAGLSPAMLRVLALEQGATDKLCEYSPSELLRLIYDVFGDKITLDNYEHARETQINAEKELEQLRLKTARLELELENKKIKERSYLEYKHLSQESSRLEIEMKALARFIDTEAEIKGSGYQLNALRKEVRELNGTVSGLSLKVVELTAEEAEIKKARDAAKEESYKVQRRLNEKIVDRTVLQTSLAEIERLSEAAKGVDPEDIDVLKTKHEETLEKKWEVKKAIETVDAELSGFKTEIRVLESGSGKPEPHIDEFSGQLSSSGISHKFLYEGVDVAEEKWRLAIESILRGYKYVIVLDDPSQRRLAWEMAEKARYRHFIVPEPGNEKIEAPKGTALDAVRLAAFIPGWVRNQLANIFLVDTVADGQTLPDRTTFVTAKGFMREKRGGRSMAVSEADFVFGAAARKNRIRFLKTQIKLNEELAEQKRSTLDDLGKSIKDIDLRLERQVVLAAYVSKKEDAPGLSTQLHDVILSIKTLENEHASLQSEHNSLQDCHDSMLMALTTSRNEFESAKRELEQKSASCAAQRRERLRKLKEFRNSRSKFPAGLRTQEKIAAFKVNYGDLRGVQRAIDEIERKLNGGDWEREPNIVELRIKAEKDYVSEKENIVQKESEFEETKRVTEDARMEYINVLRNTIKFYEKNLRKLASLAKIDVEVIKPVFGEDAATIKQAELIVRWNFDGKGFINSNDGEASGGQQVIKSLILLIALMMDDDKSRGGFVFIDEPFAHLDVFNIEKVAEFLLSTDTQFIITSPNTHNSNIYKPATLTIVTRKKQAGEPHAPVPGHLRRYNA